MNSPWVTPFWGDSPIICVGGEIVCKVLHPSDSRNLSQTEERTKKSAGVQFLFQFGLEGWWAWTLSSWSGSWPGNLPTRWVEMHQSQETMTQRSKTAMLRPRKWTNVPQKGTNLKGNAIFQPLIFRAVLVFKGVAMIHESMQQQVTIVESNESNGQPPGKSMAPPAGWFPQIASSKKPKNILQPWEITIGFDVRYFNLAPYLHNFSELNWWEH